MRATARASLAAIGFGLLVLGCHRATSLPSPPSPTSGGLTEGQALDVVRRRETDARTLAVTFKIVLRRPNAAEESSRGALVVVRPDQLRMQIFSFGVMTAFDYTVNGDRYRVRRPLEGVEKIGRFSQLPPDDPMASALDLRPLFLGDSTVASTSVRDRGDTYRVTVSVGNRRHEVDVSKRAATIEGETIYDGDRPRIVVAFRDYRLVDAVALPFAVHVEYPESRVSLDIDVARYARNQPVDPGLFEF